jgi:ABC-type multidrug transport system ATPase subunit
MSMQPPVFVVDSAAVTFGRLEVLRAASLWAHGGRLTAVFGRNGCGKTTLLRVAAGVLRAERGTIHFAGRVWRRPRLHRLAAAGLFYLPQDGLLARTRTLRSHFERLAWRFPGADIDGAIMLLGLEPLLDRGPLALSGGERRRAEMGLALARRPQCLLADEPFNGLAPIDAERIAAALRALAGQGCAVVATGHEVPLLMASADEVVWMVAGTTHALGTPAAAAASDQFRREYLGPAYASPLH